MGSRPSFARLAAAAAVGYLTGTIPSADLATRLASRRGVDDLRSAGSGNPGGVNAARVLGRRWGAAVMAADVSKGALASVLGRRLAGGAGANVGGTASVVGHCYPVWQRFRGGKGVATSAGQSLVVFPVYAPVDLAVAAAAAATSRRALTATAISSACWVGAATLWWCKGWPNAWGPRPSAWLPLCAGLTSAVIIRRFVTAESAE